MTKLLNIDTIAPLADREIVLNGEHYKVKETSVQLFLEVAEFEKKNANIDSLQGQVQAMIDLIKKFIPDLPEEVLMRATLDQLGLMVRFIRNDVDDDELNENPVPKTEGEAEEVK